jgi:pimeloyl-ACP methyl ester carboxylesterase
MTAFLGSKTNALEAKAEMTNNRPKFVPTVFPKNVKYSTLSVDGLNIAYREAGQPGSPKLVLLHGFPSSSHQYRNLIPALADRFHVISPDYPGFGNSDIPDPQIFAYTFDKIAEVIGHFLAQKGFDRYGLFAQDYGGLVGFRIVTDKPEALEWLIIQNTNAYEIGFTAAWGGSSHIHRFYHEVVGKS